MQILLPVLIFDVDFVYAWNFVMMAPTAMMVSHSGLIMPAGATPFFFMRYNV